MSEYKSLNFFSLVVAYHENGYTRNYISYKLIYLKKSFIPFIKFGANKAIK